MRHLEGYDFPANVHLFSRGHFIILLDVNSGAIHLLDEVAAEFISALMEHGGNYHLAEERCHKLYGKEKTTEVAEEIWEAINSQVLFTRPEMPVLNTEEMPVKALCLNVAHLCNMRCGYCFAQQGDFGMEKGLMSQEVGCRAIDFLIERSGQVKNLEVDFFGGEPLLNWDVVQTLLEYGRTRARENGKKIRFTLTTNAVLLDQEIMDTIVREGVSVILSLDGRKEVNDRYRVLSNGQGSYDTIFPRIQQMVAKKPASYYIRGTFSRSNLDFTQDFEHLVACGFTNVSLEPAVGPYPEFAIGEADLPGVLSEYDKLTEALWSHYQAGRDINFFHFNLDLNRGPCLAKRLTGCGAGGEYLAITPGGDVYPCHQFVGQEDFLMGNVCEGHLDSGVRARFTGNHLANKEECLGCWARFFCGGGCFASAYFTNRDLAKPARVACAMHRKRIECAIFLDIMKKLA